MEFVIPESADKETVFKEVKAQLDSLELKIADTDDQRPWGGFFVIAKESESRFIDLFFPEVDKADIYKYGSELSPKILLVEPNKKLSWQYHNRRAELWKAVIGPVGVMVSETDTPPETHDLLQTGEFVQHDNRIRHRLIGLDSWGVVAEIWQHTDPTSPSDEADNTRLIDDFGRN